MSRQDKTIPSRSPDESAKPKKNKGLKVFGVIAAVIIGLLVIAAVTLIVLMFKGQRNAVGDNKDAAGTFSVPEEAEATVETAGDTNTYVYYNGKKYEYNEKVTTILFAGVDKHADEQIGTFGTAGQADTILVAALNTETGKYRLMAISRDTMTDVNVYDKNGTFKATENKQVCLAYAYCDGREESCENLKKSVSRIMFGIPINSYVAMDLDAIPILNDGIGGVEVNVIEDLSMKDPALTLGSTVTLMGDQAETFVRHRDTNGDENQNNLRMERQKEYLSGFIKKSLALTKEDITTPVKLYRSVDEYLVTDISVANITYYTSIFLKSGFSADENLVKIPGTTTVNNNYAEYHTDNAALFEMILDMYYTEVE